MIPTFSVVIPTYNQPAELTGCLAALSELDYPRERFEVIVVNDGGGSLDHTLAPFFARLNLVLAAQPHAGPAAARNQGVAPARGKFIAFTDSDCRPDRDWLANLDRELAADEDILVGGRVLNSLDDNAYSTASQLLVSYLYAYYNSDREQARFFTSNNMAVARDRFLTAGGFNAFYHRAAAEDRELCDRWVHSGRRMVFVESAVVRHSHRLTLRLFWRQHFGYGRGALHYHQAKASRDAEPVKLEPLRFYFELLRYPWAAKVRRPTRTAALLFVSQTANALGFVREKLLGRSTPQALQSSAAASKT